jgi:hypothetical protein
MPFAGSLKSRRRIETETNHLEKEGMVARNKDLHFVLAITHFEIRSIEAERTESSKERRENGALSGSAAPVGVAYAGYCGYAGGAP